MYSVQQLSIFVLGAISLWLWWRELTIRKQSGTGLFGAATRSIRGIGLVDVLAAAFLVMIASAIVRQAVQVPTSAVNTFAQAIALFGFWLLLRTRHPEFSEWLAPGWTRFRQDVVSGIRGCVLVLPWLLTLNWVLSLLIPYRHSNLDAVRNSTQWADVMSGWFGTVACTGFFEEMLFRGILQSWLIGLYPLNLFNRPDGLSKMVLGEFVRERSQLTMESQGASWFAVLVTSYLFSLAHFGQGAAPVPLFLLSIFLGWLFMKTNSLWSCIVAHMCFNAFTMLWVTLEWALG
ncbi:MAG: CPBP family intramembrane glutamic endopeptidase [Pirellulaceae bacterium]